MSGTAKDLQERLPGADLKPAAAPGQWALTFESTQTRGLRASMLLLVSLAVFAPTMTVLQKRWHELPTLSKGHVPG